MKHVHIPITLALLLAVPAVAQSLHDPMRPPVPVHASTVSAPPPTLSAVIGTPGDQVAIFNGQIVHTGDLVGGYTIVNIFEDRVTFRHAGSTQTVYLPHPATFKQASTSTARSSMGDP